MIKQADEQTAETIRAVSEAMGLLRADMEAIDKVALKVAGRTTRIFRFMQGFLAVAAIYMVFLVYTMGMNMSSMNLHLQEMYGKFGIMADNMHQITTSVTNISQNVQGIPVIKDHMINMNENVAAMLGSVEGMNTNVNGMNGNMINLHNYTAEMSQHFKIVNNTVQYMRYNTNQMSNPMRIFP